MTRWMGWALAAWIGLFAALSAWAEDAPAGAAERASALVQAHRRAIEQGDLVAAKAALTALLQVAEQAASEDDTALLEALLDAYGAARRTLRGDADGALFAGKLLAALAQRAAKTDKDHALDVWTARAFARAHAELGAAEAFPEAAAELDRLRALAAEHAGVALVRESLALGLYNETVHVRRQQRPDARAPLLQELHALTQREDATPKTHEEYLWTLWDESDAALDRDACPCAFVSGASAQPGTGQRPWCCVHPRGGERTLCPGGCPARRSTPAGGTRRCE
jgi:hypothetical protein